MFFPAFSEYGLEDGVISRWEDCRSIKSPFGVFFFSFMSFRYTASGLFTRVRLLPDDMERRVPKDWIGFVRGKGFWIWPDRSLADRKGNLVFGSRLHWNSSSNAWSHKVAHRWRLEGPAFGITYFSALSFHDLESVNSHKMYHSFESMRSFRYHKSIRSEFPTISSSLNRVLPSCLPLPPDMIIQA